jgi:glucosamine--fructose-6-phosphate aminotransferase (isomerizing)
MCGIVGYSGKREALPLIVDCLRRLEYRGYDSAGVAVRGSSISLWKDKGTVAQLQASLPASAPGAAGIGHTRWATVGRPAKENSHPFLDCGGRVAIAHNGIIENYRALRAELEKKGHKFTSQTDSEAVAHLLEDEKGGDPVATLARVKARLDGSYAIVALFRDSGVIVGTRRESPLVAALGDGEAFIASDAPAVIPHTNRAVFLQDGDIVSLAGGKAEFFDRDGKKVERKVETLDWDVRAAEKSGYDHYMLKEIFEQPHAIRSALLGRMSILDEQWNLPDFENVRIVACGTSYHAGLVGRCVIEELLGVPVIVETSSEYRYAPDLRERSLCVLVSQSGETADTLAAARKAKANGMPLVGICNVLGSTLTREVSRVLLTQAGPEIGVAATKTFTTQIVALYLLALKLGKEKRILSADDVRRHLTSLRSLPQLTEAVLAGASKIREVAEQYAGAGHMFFIGRGAALPLALEGALKLKEVSYIHAEAYPAGELKHGPLALVTRETPVVAVLMRDRTHGKTIANVDEVVARGAPVLAIVEEADMESRAHVDRVIEVPEVDVPWMAQIPMSVALQLFAYYAARKRGCEIDKPRNLAKSVTVE